MRGQGAGQRNGTGLEEKQVDPGFCRWPGVAGCCSQTLSLSSSLCGNQRPGEGAVTGRGQRVPAGKWSCSGRLTAS